MKISKLKKGDEVVASLNKIVSKLKSGLVFGIGSLNSAKLKIYDLEEKKYLEKEFSGPLEIANFIAIIAQNPQGVTEIHPHITICDRNFTVAGGHLAEAQVGATFEYAIIKSDQKISRYYDTGIGLNLINAVQEELGTNPQQSDNDSDEVREGDNE